VGIGGAVVVVVVGGGGGGAVEVVVGAGAGSVVVVGAGAVVVVVDDVVVDDAGARYETRCDRSFTPAPPATPRDSCAPIACATCVSWAVRAAVNTRDGLADVLCNNRRGAPKSTPQMTAATPRRLPPVLWFRRAPPFSGDTVHPRRHTGARGFWRT
jgi:hypothetical protein